MERGKILKHGAAKARMTQAEILSEDFPDGQLIGSVRVRNPFAAS